MKKISKIIRERWKTRNKQQKEISKEPWRNLFEERKQKNKTTEESHQRQNYCQDQYEELTVSQLNERYRKKYITIEKMKY